MKKSIRWHKISQSRSAPGTIHLGGIRRILGMVFLLLFTYGFLGWGPVSRTLASFLSRIQLGPVFLEIAEGGLGGGAFLVAILILGSTALFGRWYCAFLCPLGTVQQWVSPRRMVQGGRLFRNSPVDAWVRYGTVGLVAALLAGGSAVGWGIAPIGLNLLDPYGLWGRILRDLIFPLLVFLNWLLFQVGRVFELYVPLFSYNPDLPVFFATLIVGGSWIVLSRKSGRVYCGSLCPVGTFGQAEPPLHPSRIAGNRSIRLPLDFLSPLCVPLSHGGSFPLPRRVWNERAVPAGDGLQAGILRVRVYPVWGGMSYGRYSPPFGRSEETSTDRTGKVRTGTLCGDHPGYDLWSLCGSVPYPRGRNGPLQEWAGHSSHRQCPLCGMREL